MYRIQNNSIIEHKINILKTRMGIIKMNKKIVQYILTLIILNFALNCGGNEKKQTQTTSKINISNT